MADWWIGMPLRSTDNVMMKVRRRWEIKGLKQQNPMSPTVNQLVSYSVYSPMMLCGLDG